MAFNIRWKVIVEIDKKRIERIIVAPDKDRAIETACKIAENMGGTFICVILL